MHLLRGKKLSGCLVAVLLLLLLLLLQLLLLLLRLLLQFGIGVLYRQCPFH